jgi:hypothetical protein
MRALIGPLAGALTLAACGGGERTQRREALREAYDDGDVIERKRWDAKGRLLPER